jgi:hypothetical protein
MSYCILPPVCRTNCLLHIVTVLLPSLILGDDGCSVVLVPLLRYSHMWRTTSVVVELTYVGVILTFVP